MNLIIMMSPWGTGCTSGISCLFFARRTRPTNRQISADEVEADVALCPSMTQIHNGLIGK